MLIPTMHLTAHADCELIGADAHSERFVEWVIKAPRAPLTPARPPMNLALVIDRSGSMGGDKLRFVQQAAVHVLSLLDERDQVAVLAYDDEVQVLGASQPLTAGYRRALTHEIRKLRPGSSTNLGEGWLLGAAQVAEHLRHNSVNRVLLLTDGMANVGMTSRHELEGHAQELRQRGVSTSTFGVGVDFNEHLLEAMADHGGGHFYFIERPAQIPAVFAQELGELLTTVARDATLVISGPDTAGVELLGNLSYNYDGDRLHVPLGDLFSQQERRLYLRVVTVGGLDGSQLPVRGQLNYLDPSGDRQAVVAEVRFTWAADAQVAAAPLDAGLRARAAEIQLSVVGSEALKLERGGRHQEAEALLRQALATHGAHAAPAVLREYESLAARLQEGPLSALDSKRAFYDQSRTRKSRRPDRPVQA